MTDLDRLIEGVARFLRMRHLGQLSPPLVPLALQYVDALDAAIKQLKG